jgi:hypothetical protein
VGRAAFAAFLSGFGATLEGGEDCYPHSSPLTAGGAAGVAAPPRRPARLTAAKGTYTEARRGAAGLLGDPAPVPRAQNLGTPLPLGLCSRLRSVADEDGTSKQKELLDLLDVRVTVVEHATRDMPTRVRVEGVVGPIALTNAARDLDEVEPRRS